MTPIKVCQVLREAGNAGLSSSACGGKSQKPQCRVTDLANKKDALFQTQYGFPSKMGRQARAATLKVLRRDVEESEKAIADGYSDRGAEAQLDKVAWKKFPSCLWNADGSGGGLHKHKYFDRQDLAELGYTPRPAFGGKALEGRLPKKLTALVPVWMDRAVNPDLAVVLVFAFLVLVFAALFYGAYRTEQRKAGLEDVVAQYEAEGRDMCGYRKKHGLGRGGCAPRG